MFYRENPVFAVRDLLGVTLSTHQRLDVRLTQSRDFKDAIRLFGRGMSKTFGEALDALLSAMLIPRLKILTLGAKGFRQGKMIFEEIERIVKCELDGQMKREFALKMIDTGNRRTASSVIRKNPELWTIHFKNGSVIGTAPIGTSGDAIRGFRSHRTYVDERKDLKKEIKEKVIKPFSIIDYNVITQAGEFENVNIDSGTLEYQEDDYTQEYEEYMKMIEKGNDRYLVIKFLYPDAFNVAEYGDDYQYDSEYFNKRLKFWSVPYGIKVNDIEQELEKATTDHEAWRAEHLCVPMRATGDYYPHELIEGAKKKVVIKPDKFMEIDNDEATEYLRPKMTCNDPCVLGVDCARESDLTAFTVIRIGPLSDSEWNPITQEGKTKFCNIIWAYQERNMHDPDAAKLIYDILDMFPNIILVGMDKRGGGSGVRDQLYHIVKDGKVDAEILYDPEDVDDNGIATLVGDNSKNNRLRLLTYNDQDNTVVNRSVRNAFKEGLLYFAGGDQHLDDDIKIAQSFINIIPNQFKMIKTKPTKNWIHFFVENPKKQKKDLYSSTIYAYGTIKDLIYKEDVPKRKIEPATIAPTFNMRIR